VFFFWAGEEEGQGSTVGKAKKKRRDELDEQKRERKTVKGMGNRMTQKRIVLALPKERGFDKKKADLVTTKGCGKKKRGWKTVKEAFRTLKRKTSSTGKP